jgi:hypothetical protein
VSNREATGKTHQDGRSRRAGAAAEVLPLAPQRCSRWMQKTEGTDYATMCSIRPGDLEASSCALDHSLSMRTQHPKPYTLNPTPHILRPKPYTVSPT